MNREDIIRMAESCGIPEFENNESQADNIMRFANLVAAAEREEWANEFAGLGEWTAVHILEDREAIQARSQNDGH